MQCHCATAMMNWGGGERALIGRQEQKEWFEKVWIANDHGIGRQRRQANNRLEFEIGCRTGRGDKRGIFTGKQDAKKK